MVHPDLGIRSRRSITNDYLRDRERIRGELDETMAEGSPTWTLADPTFYFGSNRQKNIHSVGRESGLNDGSGDLVSLYGPTWNISERQAGGRGLRRRNFRKNHLLEASE